MQKKLVRLRRIEVQREGDVTAQLTRKDCVESYHVSIERGNQVIFSCLLI